LLLGSYVLTKFGHFGGAQVTEGLPNESKPEGHLMPFFKRLEIMLLRGKKQGNFRFRDVWVRKGKQCGCLCDVDGVLDHLVNNNNNKNKK